MANGAAYAELDRALDGLRRLETLDHDAAKACADALFERTRQNIAAQRDPYDHPWRLSQSGAPVLVRAIRAIQMRVSGTRIEFSINEGAPELRHHIGNARGYYGGSEKLGGFRRALIPFSKLPGPFKTVIREVLMKRAAACFKRAA